MVTLFNPMVARHADLSRLEFPLYCQPKYDGVRRLYYPGGDGWSRGLKLNYPAPVAHLTFSWPTGGVVLDGEILLPTHQYSFQQTISAYSTINGTPLSRKLEYIVYDCYVLDRPKMMFYGRLNQAENIVNLDHVPYGVRMADTYMVQNVDELMAKYDEFVAEGYEGAMVRDRCGIYESGVRSHSLLKLKKFGEDEFKIVRVGEGIGKDAGHAMFWCKTADGEEFKVRPADTYEVRAEQFSRGNDLVGKMLTVRYTILTERGVPRDPRGKGLRDYED